jgi:hypothetical protein
MSYDVELCDPETGRVIDLGAYHPHLGGTHPMDGTSEAWLNITFNYSTILRRVLGTNLREALYGKTGAETIPLLQKAIDQLRDDGETDYWKPTEGNVRRALIGLLFFATQRPDGVWRGD